MHLSEGILPLEDAVAWSALVAPLLLWSLKAPLGSSVQERALLVASTSLLFATTLLPIPLPGLGLTSHLCLTPVLAIFLGVRRVIWPTFCILLLQALFFAHGGLTTLGVNTFTLGFIGPFVGVGIARGCLAAGLGHGLSIGIACAVGQLSVYGLDALILARAIKDVAGFGPTLTMILLALSPVQLPLAFLEGLVSVGLARHLTRRRPSLIPAWMRDTSKQGASVVLLVGVSLGVVGCDYRGIDDMVFGQSARAAGRAPMASLLDLSQGELGLGATIVLLFGVGFAAGRAYERLMQEPP